MEARKSFPSSFFFLASHLADLFVVFPQFSRLALYFLVGSQVYEGSYTLIS